MWEGRDERGDDDDDDDDVFSFGVFVDGERGEGARDDDDDATRRVDDDAHVEEKDGTSGGRGRNDGRRRG